MDKVIGGCPDDTSPVEMEEGVKNDVNDEKEITAENEDLGVINRYVIENEVETNQDILDKVLSEWPDDTSPIGMEEGVNNEDDGEK